MKAFKKYTAYKNDVEFWSFIRYVSESLKYSKKQTILKHSAKEIKCICDKNNITYSNTLVNDAENYISMRADLLNDSVKPNLMDVSTAKLEFEKLYAMGKYKCKFFNNKQKNEKAHINYFSAIINMITENTLLNPETDKLPFDDDPHKYLYFYDKNNKIVGSSCRWFDGAYPSTNSPKLVWEIKEYYYTSTFGSKLSDAIYVAQLDGYEFEELRIRTGTKPINVLLIDSIEWWNHGLSYLCKIIDILNRGFIDELIVGKEVFTRWIDIINSVK